MYINGDEYPGQAKQQSNSSNSNHQGTCTCGSFFQLLRVYKVNLIQETVMPITTGIACFLIGEAAILTNSRYCTSRDTGLRLRIRVIINYQR